MCLSKICCRSTWRRTRAFALEFSGLLTSEPPGGKLSLKPCKHVGYVLFGVPSWLLFLHLLLQLLVLLHCYRKRFSQDLSLYP